MAQGTVRTFTAFKRKMGDGTHDLDTHVFKLALITTLPTVADVSPSLGSYTEVSGTNYTAGGNTLTMTWTEDGNFVDWKHTGGDIIWTQSGTGPDNIMAGLIYNDTLVGKDAVAFIDLSGDGGITPISLQDSNVTWKPETSGNKIFRLS